MFVFMPARRPQSDLQAVLELKERGLTDREASAATGVPINTIRGWRKRRPKYASAQVDRRPLCPVCGDDLHETGDVEASPYSYLLGIYLGDGCLTRNGTSWTLRVTLDAAYPGIISECVRAIRAVSGERFLSVRNHPSSACVEVSCTWRRWLCLFPQHGPGRKHRRKIQLTDWQRRIVTEMPQPFLRGLIQTDGWRGLNRVRVKGKDYAYPRYQFSNRSDDIRKLFTDTCERLGVEWRQWTRYHVSVARRESVALLDAFIGPKY
jgi:hypothetical protein